MILHPSLDGFVAIPQSSHAFLAFQLAELWGNRVARRPSLRAELLAAVLLHDAGWDGREEPPRLGPAGAPLAFDTWPDEEREAIWTAGVERAGLRGRYVAYLVSHHVSHLASLCHTAHDEFLAREEARRASLAADLAHDARAAQVLATGADAADVAILRVCDALAVHLSRGITEAITVPAMAGREGPMDLTVETAGSGVHRLRPWPLRGDRLVVHAEGRNLPARSFADEPELQQAWRVAPWRRVRFELLATAARSSRLPTPD